MTAGGVNFSAMMDWIVRICLWAWSIGFLCVSFYWLWLHPVALVVVSLMAAWLFWLFWDERRKDKRCEREGYRVTFTSDRGVLFYVTYYEGEDSFDLIAQNKKVIVPTPNQWERMPKWAQGRRDEIINRIRQRYPRLVD